VTRSKPGIQVLEPATNPGLKTITYPINQILIKLLYIIQYKFQEKLIYNNRKVTMGIAV
jgi:hypothetical protein